MEEIDAHLDIINDYLSKIDDYKKINKIISHIKKK